MKIESGLHDFADFSPVPPSTYTFALKEPLQVEPSVDQKTDIGGKLFKFTQICEIQGGEHSGKKVYRRFSNKSKGSRYFMKSFLDKIGVAISKEGAFTSEELLGKRFSAAVNDRMYTDDAGNQKKGNELDTESIVKQ